jgi:FkbM family methyltransferase
MDIPPENSSPFGNGVIRPTAPFQFQVVDYVPQLRLGLRIECDPTNFIDRYILANGIWEPLVLSALHALVKPGDVCVDVGANAGYLSLVMAGLVGAAGKVLSFEPNRAIVPKFRRNLELNPSLQSRIELHTTGLGREATTMFLAPDESEIVGNASLVSLAGAITTESIRVETLDSHHLPRVDCMKIDVEGMELDVLMGASKTIAASRPVIVFETLRARPPEHHLVVANYLREFGYGIYSVDFEGKKFKPITTALFPQEDTYAIHPARFKL